MTMHRFLRAPLIGGAAAIAVVILLATGQAALAQTPDDSGQGSNLQKKGASKQQDKPGAGQVAPKPSPAGKQGSARKPQHNRPGVGVQGPPSPLSRKSTLDDRRRSKQPKRGSAPKPTVVLKPGEVPAIEFDTQVWDFGRIRAGYDVKHEFWFTNTGTGPLEILRVKPG